MGKETFILGSAIFMLTVIAGWQIASSEWANFELYEDLRDLTLQLGSRYGYVPPSTDEQLRSDVICESKDHQLELEPSQMTVQRTGTAQDVEHQAILDGFYVFGGRDDREADKITPFPA